jgi:hypothetical protein
MIPIATMVSTLDSLTQYGKISTKDGIANFLTKTLVHLVVWEMTLLMPIILEAMTKSRGSAIDAELQDYGTIFPNSREFKSKMKKTERDITCTRTTKAITYTTTILVGFVSPNFF